MYYQSQLRSLQKQAQLQRRLAAVTYAQDLISSRRQQPLNRSRNLARSRRQQQDQQTSVHLQRSRIEAELQASSVSTTAILNRSRIQSALEVRQKNLQLNTERERSFVQEQYSRAAELAAEEQLWKERNRQAELATVREVHLREELYQRMRVQKDEILEFERRKLQEKRSREDLLRRQLYQEELVRQQVRQREIQRYGMLSRPYYYF